jgi:hypothetical protein
MQYAYGYQLNGTQAGGLDPDAKAYINSVVAAGATVSSTQRNAINNFYKIGKTEGWYSLLKRLYLPIWAIASPNAIDMVSRTSGTFAGGITHSAGYATGNGTTGYFDYNTSAVSQGLSTATGLLFWLGYTAATAGVQLGGYNGSGTGTRAVLNSSSASSVTSEMTSLATSVSATVTGAGLGILLSTRTSTTSHKIFQRRTAFAQRGATSTTAETSTSASVNQNAWARGQSGTRTSFSNAGLGAHGFGLGMTDAQAENFTLALKNLWETSTGLVLP